MRRRGRDTEGNDTRSATPPLRNGPRLWLAIILLTWLAIIAWQADGARPLALVYLVMSAVAFACYGNDKSAARHARRRIPERRLHAIALLGGWPGALLAQAWFRHKSSKTSFQVAFWLIVLLHVAALAWVLQQGWLDVAPATAAGHAMLDA
jgi:uncharacterized membrane protein YsdA (DUF1294 family)